MASVYTNDLIETQVYQLTYVAGNRSSDLYGPIQNIDINVPFKVRKIVFKPMCMYVATGSGAAVNGPNGNGVIGDGDVTNDSPDLMFCNLYDVNKAIGYTGFYNNVAIDSAGEPGPMTPVYYQQRHDVTFSVRNLMNINGSYKFYLYNSASKSYYSVQPWSGIITITVEYHGY